MLGVLSMRLSSPMIAELARTIDELEALIAAQIGAGVGGHQLAERD